jgi:hypothetical protein
MREVRVIVRDYKPGAPWIVVREHAETVAVRDGVPVWEAIHRAYPVALHSVTVEPGQGL